MLEVSKVKLHYYNIVANILIFMLYFVILDILNLIIKLSQEPRSIRIMIQSDLIADLDIMLA